MNRHLRGDTIIEVIFAITVFCMVSILTIAMMNQGLATGTASLEITLAREEMDAQAEAIRFIHDSYEVERNLPVVNQTYEPLWRALRERIVGDVAPFERNGETCEIPTGDGIFALNTRKIDPRTTDRDGFDGVGRTIVDPAMLVDGVNRFRPAPLFARVVYLTDADDVANTNLVAATGSNEILQVEGIWVQAVQVAGSPVIDFHIRACWSAAGRKVVTTLGTIMRVYDPDR
ncbi:MAG: hypothetical protein LBM97_02570 [Candidatus Nomurabacteria bacterium]|nr:hypothetical protein [Candidatus Nomurabacteria bacterium]